MARINPSDDRLPPMTPQLAMRVAVAGSVALVLFAVIFLRLWFLQVLTGNQYVAQAKTNEVRDEEIAAPRGQILASNGDPLVTSAKVPAILIAPQSLPVPPSSTPTASELEDPPEPDQQLYNRLAPVLGMKTSTEKCSFTLVTGGVVQKLHPQLAEIPCLVAQQVSQIAYANVTLATNVPVAEQAYISERQNAFPGVSITQVAVRQYPEKTLAAQLLGTVGPISLSQLKSANFKGIPETDEVGQDGLEYQYNSYLQGKDGHTRVKVNSFGDFEGYESPVQPTPGYNLKTSIDLGLERVGQASLQQSITDADTQDGGAFVAMSPETGQVYGMGSLPSFNPTVFTRPMTQQQYDSEFTSTASDDPLLNRATQSVGPDGSTFKVITSTAALATGEWTVNEDYDDSGQYCNSGQCQHNSSGEGGAGEIDLTTALEISDDDFFYNLGARLNTNDPATHPQGGPLQAWAKKFGIGQTPGIDLPYASSGTLPTPAFVAQRIKEEQQCDAGTGPYSYTNGDGGFSTTPEKGYHKTPVRPINYCGIAILPNVGWTVGDNFHMALGQGDVQVSPLQLAMVYSAIANGGKLVTPHIGQDIETSDGTVLQQIPPGPVRNLDINPTYLATIQEGLRLAASGPGGTSTDVMGSFKLPVYGKTGTAQYIAPAGEPNAGVEEDYAWYAAYVPASATRKPIVVVVWVEQGGFGDQTAAPVARQILSQWFYGKPGPFIAGTSTDH